MASYHHTFRRTTMHGRISMAFALVTAIACTGVLSHPHNLNAISPLLDLRRTFDILPISPPTQSTPCFASDPGIAGIGVRASTYFQFLLLFVTTFVFVFDGYVDSREQRLIEKSYTSLLITACALIFSAIVKAAQLKLDIYHALIVLDLSWVLIANALVICVLPTIDGQSQTRWRKWMWTWWPSRAGQLPAIILVSLHLCAMGGLGLYVWSNPVKIGISTECTSAMTTSVFASRISVTSPRLRIVSLFFYSIAAIPIFNAVVFTAFAIAAVNLANNLIPTPYTYGRLYRITVLLQAVVNVCLIISTEFTINRNRGLVASGESDWGFGQILALMLVIGPLIGVIYEMTPKIQSPTLKRCTGEMQYRIRMLLRKTEVSWPDIYKQSDRMIDAVLAYASVEPTTGPDSLGLEATKSALKTAQTLLAAANAIMQSSEKSSEGDQVLSTIQIPPSESIEDAMEKLHQVWEYISKVCALRFSDVHNSTSFLVVKAYLEATKDSLGSAKAALEGYYISHASGRSI